MGLSICFGIALPNQEAPPAKKDRKLRKAFVERFFPKTEWEERSGDLPAIAKIPLECELRGRFSIHLLPHAAALLQSLSVDVLLNFTNHILRGDILTIPRYGVWSYHHGDPSQFRGLPPGFWEIYHNAPTTGAILQRLEDSLDDGAILRQATLPTIKHSYYQQRAQLFAQSVPWMAEVARKLVDGGELPDSNVQATDAPIFTKPTDLELALFSLRLLWNKLQYRFGMLA